MKPLSTNDFGPTATRTSQRRRTLAALCAGAFAPLAAFAQQQDKVRRIGFLAPRSRSTAANPDEFYDAFVAGMNALGYVEGKNLIIEWRFADGKFERLPALAAELVDLKVEVIVVDSTPAALAAQRATRTIPIVTTAVGDPVASGLAASLRRPGGNITGLSSISYELMPKQLELLRKLIPKLSRTAMLINPDTPAHPALVKQLQTVAQPLGIKVAMIAARSIQDLETGMAKLMRDRTEALIIAPDPFFTGQVRAIAALALKHRMASIYTVSPTSAQAGGLMSYGASNVDSFRRAAIFVDKILRGAKAGDLPFEQPTLFRFVINRRTAKALGLTISEELQLRADEVIE